MVEQQRDKRTYRDQQSAVAVVSMSRWSSRSNIYKWSLIGLYLMFLCYMAAFSVPTWYGNDVDDANSYFKGLWLQCDNIEDDADFDNCTVVAFGDDKSGEGYIYI